LNVGKGKGILWLRGGVFEEYEYASVLYVGLDRDGFKAMDVHS
jgi:hypothetical protein